MEKHSCLFRCWTIKAVAAPIWLFPQSRMDMLRMPFSLRRGIYRTYSVRAIALRSAVGVVIQSQAPPDASRGSCQRFRMSVMGIVGRREHHKPSELRGNPLPALRHVGIPKFQMTTIFVRPIGIQEQKHIDTPIQLRTREGIEVGMQIQFPPGAVRWIPPPPNVGSPSNPRIPVSCFKNSIKTLLIMNRMTCLVNGPIDSSLLMDDLWYW